MNVYLVSIQHTDFVDTCVCMHVRKKVHNHILNMSVKARK